MKTAATNYSQAQARALILLIAALSIGLSACSRQPLPEDKRNPPVAAQTPAAETSAATRIETPVKTEKRETDETPAPDLTPGRPAEISLAVARIYEKAVTIDEQSARQAVVGDFNGDGSADIAVVVRPSAAQLGEVNSEVANWIIEDPHGVVIPDPTKTVQQLPVAQQRAKIDAGDTLLAIIHGYKETGWRNPEAKQSYLLKNAVGSGMKLQPLRKANSAAPKGKRFPHLFGDVISETLDAQTGMLYWTGAKYGWYH